MAELEKMAVECLKGSEVTEKVKTRNIQVTASKRPS